MIPVKGFKGKRVAVFGLGQLDGPVGFGMGQRHAGRQHQGGEAGPVGLAQVGHCQAFGGGGLAGGGLFIPHHHLGPASHQRARGGQAGPGQAEHGDTLAFKTSDGDHDGFEPPLSQLQGGQADHGQDDGHDPEADHDRRLGPAELFEVMVNRGHQEDPTAGALEIGHLNDH